MRASLILLLCSVLQLGVNAQQPQQEEEIGRKVPFVLGLPTVKETIGGDQIVEVEQLRELIKPQV